MKSPSNIVALVAQIAENTSILKNMGEYIVYDILDEIRFLKTTGPVPPEILELEKFLTWARRPEIQVTPPTPPPRYPDRKRKRPEWYQSMDFRDNKRRRL